MRIGIDMRMAGTGEGIARYSEQLVRHLSITDHENDYFLLVASHASLKFRIENPKFHIVVIKSTYYSWAEQFRFIWEIYKLKLDLMHFTNFNHPVLYPGKFVTTIHDIIHHKFPGKKKARLLYRLAYRLTMRTAVTHAEKIIAVSETTKHDIVTTFKTSEDKVKVIYEGVDEEIKTEQSLSKIHQVLRKYDINKPYILFVGVWRRYKNLARLARAFDIIKERYEVDCQLVLVGKIDPFYPEIKTEVMKTKNAKDIFPLGYVPDEDLALLYRGAKAFALPSLTEGFGLIGVEAQTAGVPVAASNIPVLEEILGQGAIYFDPKNIADMAQKINFVLSDRQLPERLALAGKENAQKYDWDKAARETLQIYEQVINQK